MSYLKSLFFVLITTISVSALSDEVAIPKPGDDLKLTGGLKAQEFFSKRALPSSCRTQWQSTWERYKVIKSEFDQLSATHPPADVLDAKEAELVRYRQKTLLPVTEECGPCATQEVTSTTVHAPTGSQQWMVTDGSCYFPHATKEEHNAAFDRAKDFLSNTGLFARHNGGFESILEFTPINRATGAFLPQIPKLTPGTSVDTFIAVRGPGRIAFNYLFENSVNLVESADGTREFIVVFTGLPRPNGFSPRIHDITLAGTKRNITFKWDITRVKGMWYVRNDGYYRYFTGADFEMPLTVGTGFARVTLLDTVMTLAERGN